MEWVFQRIIGGKSTRSVESPCARLVPDVDIVHVVRLSDRPPQNAFDILDASERARAGRFVFEADRLRFIAAHAWTRLALGPSIGCSPESVAIAAGPHGKPYLTGAPNGTCFNLSHSGERALLAIALDRPVGVDIEQHRAVDPLELARRFFARDEIEALEALDDEARTPAFFRCWTRKEAVIKATGDGLSLPLDGFAVRIGKGQSSQVVQTSAVARAAGACWRVVPLETEAGYEAAVAGAAGEWDVIEWDISGA